MKIIKKKILGVSVSPLDYGLALKVIDKWIKNKKKEYVCVSAVHLLMECQTDSGLKNGVNLAGMVTSDGMPLVWILKYLRNSKNAKRVYGPELTLRLCELASKNNYKVFLLGGSAGEGILLEEILKTKYPGLIIAGHCDTPVRPIPDNQEVLDMINKSGAQIVLVGLGCPYQEKWMIENRSKIDANVLIGVGAAFDFITGKEKQAPLWIQNRGFEWLFRLIQNPKRLWRRYLVLNTKFLISLSKEFFITYRG